jgi:transposase
MWKNLLESASESVNNDLRLRNGYLIAENRILRNQIHARVQLTDTERKELAEIGAELEKKALAEIATLAKPDTILAWNRKFSNEKVDTSKPSKSVGRLRVDSEIEDLVLRMARENRSWGYDRIQGALKHLGYSISDQSVGNILKRHGLPPAPERKKTLPWGEFVRSHLDVLLAVDFFRSEAWNALGLIISYLLSLLDLGRHPIHSMRWLLYQQMPGACSFLLNVLNLSVHVQSWDGWFKTVTRPRLPWFRIGIRQPTYPGFNSPYQRKCRLQGTGKVAVLPCLELASIWDGPIEGEDLRRIMFRDNLPEAA